MAVSSSSDSWIGASVLRKEDARHLLGHGMFIADLRIPGVQDVASRDNLTNGVGFSVNGTRPRANNFLLDGQDNNDSNITGQATQTINHEAIGEVTILQNSYSSEFGRGGGSVTNEVFKGGTNNWHRSAKPMKSFGDVSVVIPLAGSAPLFVLGLGLGWLALRTQSLIGPLFVHALFNAVAGTVLVISKG